MERIKVGPSIEIDLEIEDNIEGLHNVFNTSVENRLSHSYNNSDGSIQRKRAPEPIDCSKCKFLCHTKISEETRSELCKEFHYLNFERQRYFILRLVTEKDSQEERGDIQLTSRRKFEYFFYYKKRKRRVCQRFFLATLCIRSELVSSVLSSRNEYGFFVEEDTPCLFLSSKAPRPDSASDETILYLDRTNGNSNIIKVENVEKGPIPNLVNHPKPVNCGCTFKCDKKISEEDRIRIYEQFNKLSDPSRKDFLISIIEEPLPKTHKNRNPKACKNSNRLYFFISKNQKHRVCKVFFHHTLCISHSSIDRAFRQRNEFGIYKGFQHDKKVENTNQKFIHKPNVLDFVKEHIECYPEVYTAINQVPPKKIEFGETLTIANMYRLYVDRCEVAGIQYVKEPIFKEYLRKNYKYTVKPIAGKTIQRYTIEKSTLAKATTTKPTIESPMLINPTIESPMLTNPTIESPMLTNPTIVKCEIDIDDTNNEYSEDLYEVEEQGMEVVAGSDCFTIYQVKSQESDGLR